MEIPPVNERTDNKRLREIVQMLVEAHNTAHPPVPPPEPGPRIKTYKPTDSPQKEWRPINGGEVAWADPAGNYTPVKEVPVGIIQSYKEEKDREAELRYATQAGESV